MKRRIFILACVAALAVAGLTFWMARSGPEEPVYHGRPASYWIAHLHDPVESPPKFPEQFKVEPSKAPEPLKLDASLRLSPQRPDYTSMPSARFPIIAAHPQPHVEETPSWQAIRAMGPSAIPFLLKELDNDDAEMRRNAQLLLQSFAPITDDMVGLMARKIQVKESRTHKFYRGLWSALPKPMSHYLPTPIVPSTGVSPILDYWGQRAGSGAVILREMFSRAQALQPGDPKIMEPFHHGLPALERALRDDEDWVCGYSLSVLDAIGPEASNAAPDLIRQFQNPARDFDLRVRIAGSLRNIAPESREVVAALVSATTSSNRILQCAGVVGLNGGGGDRQKIAPAETLKRLQEDRGPAKQDALIALKNIWHGDDPLLKCFAYNGIKVINPDELKDVPSPKPPPQPPSHLPLLPRNSDTIVTYTDYTYPPRDSTDDFFLYLRFNNKPPAFP